MSEWELTDEEIAVAHNTVWRGIGDPCSLPITERHKLEALSDHAIATAAVKKYRAHLASQCGDDPCKGCMTFGGDPTPEATKAWCRSHGACEKYHAYEGQLAQAAKGQQLLQEAVKQREKEAYTRVLALMRRCFTLDVMRKEVELWLQERGKQC